MKKPSGLSTSAAPALAEDMRGQWASERGPGGYAGGRKLPPGLSISLHQALFEYARRSHRFQGAEKRSPLAYQRQRLRLSTETLGASGLQNRPPVVSLPRRIPEGSWASGLHRVEPGRSQAPSPTIPASSPRGDSVSEVQPGSTLNMPPPAGEVNARSGSPRGTTSPRGMNKPGQATAGRAGASN